MIAKNKAIESITSKLNEIYHQFELETDRNKKRKLAKKYNNLLEKRTAMINQIMKNELT